ncbi:hypothetical protein [Ferrimonas balearica]|uniref:hypothetical protein n=1 Tax=Ferrimonas balearica TaxID=44012 RepID=UPI001C990A60|nr:hypothetical protein [Ferrimonas balearica]MBY5920809.1 hypothetical protein [Ferrimonas balearica]MBY5996506.1 hypothetical protein [Ferrimonas balearica]
MNALKFALPALAVMSLMGCSSDDSKLPEPEPEHPIMPAPDHPIEPDRENPIEAVPERPIEDVEGDPLSPDLALLGPALMIPSDDGTEFVLRFVDGKHVKEEAFLTELLPTNLNEAAQQAEIRNLTSKGGSINWTRMFRGQWGGVEEYTIATTFSGTWQRAAPEYELVLPGRVWADSQQLEFEHLGEQDYLVQATIRGLNGPNDIESPDCQMSGQLHRLTNEAGYIGEIVGATCDNLVERHQVKGYIAARTVDGEVSIQLHAELHQGTKPVLYYGGDFLTY